MKKNRWWCSNDYNLGVNSNLLVLNAVKTGPGASTIMLLSMTDTVG